jgi:hypothetical protein
MLESTTTFPATPMHQQSMDPIQKYARDLGRCIEQCLSTYSAAAAPSHMLPTHPLLCFQAAQPSGLSRRRRTTARLLIRASARPYFTATTIITDLLSAAPRFGMLRNLYRLLAPPPSAHTIYHHRTRAGVRNYWHQGANVLTVSLPTPQRKNEENPSMTVRPYLRKIPNCL